MNDDGQAPSPGSSGHFRKAISALLHPGKRTAAAVVLLVIGGLGLLGVSWTAIARVGRQINGVHASGRITDTYSRTQTVHYKTATNTITTYFVSFTFDTEGGTYNGTWEVPDASSLERMPVGTPITVSYPPGKPNLAQPVGEPFDTSDNNPILVILGVLLEILIEGFLPLLMVAIGIALLRGAWRGRTMLTQDPVEDI